MSQSNPEKPIALRGMAATSPAREDNPGAQPSKNTIKSIRDLAGQTATWRQPSPLRQEFEMAAGDEVVATLRWKKIGGSSAIARAPEGTWTFKAAGYLSPRVTIRLPNSDYDFGTFRANSNGSGQLESLGEQKFPWRCVNFLQNSWAFFDDAGNKPTASVEIGVKAAGRQEVGFLVILAWYLLILAADDVAAANPPATP